MRPSEVIFTAATIVSLIGFNCWQYFPEEFGFYGKCISIAILGWIYSVHRLVPKHRWGFYCFTLVVSWWGVVNCGDELFFDPYTKGLMGFIFALLTAIGGYLKYKKYKPLWVLKLQRWVRRS